MMPVLSTIACAICVSDSVASFKASQISAEITGKTNSEYSGMAALQYTVGAIPCVSNSVASFRASQISAQIERNSETIWHTVGCGIPGVLKCHYTCSRVSLWAGSLTLVPPVVRHNNRHARIDVSLRLLQCH